MAGTEDDVPGTGDEDIAAAEAAALDGRKEPVLGEAAELAVASDVVSDDGVRVRDHATEPSPPDGLRERLAFEAALQQAVDRFNGLSDELGALTEGTASLTAGLRDAAGRYAGIVKKYDGLLQRKSRHLMALMVTSIAVVLVCLGLVVVMSVSFSRQVNNMNALSLALGKRLAEVNSGLVTFEELNGSIRSLESAVVEVTSAVAAQRAELGVAVVQLQEAGAAQVLRTQELVRQETAATSGQLQRLAAESNRVEQSVETNSSSLLGLQRELQALKAAIEPLADLRTSVSALVTLERERYLDAINAQRRAAEADASVQALPSFRREAPDSRVAAP